jgi:hypothetical protein
MGRRRGGQKPQSKMSGLFGEPPNPANGKSPIGAPLPSGVLPGKLAGIVEEGEKKADSIAATVQAKVDEWKTNPTWATTIRRATTTSAGRRKTLRTKFDHCVKAVRKTVKARKGSNKESAAIAICTKTVLHPHGRTLKRYRKGRLLTQKKMRGGNQCY